MKRLFNSIWILLLAFLGFAFVICFSYLFLFYEDLQTNDGSVEDQLVSDKSWIRKVLFNHDHDSAQVMYSQKYGEYLLLEQQCNKTLSNASPKFSKLVLMIIDALRVDFIPSIKNPNFSTPRMPYIEQLIKTHGVGLQSIASIPTVTLARVKAILSGCLPSFMDYIMNLNAYSFKSDNIVHHLSKRNKSIVFYGDDIWGKLFNQTIFRRFNLTSSMFARDFTEVDTNVTYNVKRDLADLSDWDVMMMHYLGVDHIGHLYGYNSDRFPAKLNEMDDVFRNIFDTVSSRQAQEDSYLILITGDHGMTNSGNHGGNTREETHTALVFVSSNKSHVFPDGSIKHFSLQERTILQIDIASTVAALFGFSFPSKSQGRIISSVLERFDTPNDEHLCLLFQNAFHIQGFITRDKLDEPDLKNYLIDALTHHYRHFNGLQQENDLTEQQLNFEKSRDKYQQFILRTQQQYVKTATNRSFFSLFTVFIVLCYLIVLILLYVEFMYNYCSVFFSYSFKLTSICAISEWFPNSQIESLDYSDMAMSFPHLRFFASASARALMMFLFLLNLIFMGSTNFMEYEHLFWHFLASFLLVFKLFLVITSFISFSLSKLKSISKMKSHYYNVIICCLLSVTLFKLMVSWKIPVINEGDLEYWDFHSWIVSKDSKHYRSALFFISLFTIGFVTPTSLSFDRPPIILLLSLVSISFYQGLSGSIETFKFSQNLFPILADANFWAQAVYAQVTVLVIFCFLNKLKKSSSLKTLLNLLTDSLMSRENTIHFDSLLNCFLLCWLILSTLLLDVSYVPLLALNIMLEKMVHFVFCTTDELPKLDTIYLYRQVFYRLGTYLIFASSSFYQIGNTNSLSTVNVNSCFVGLQSYMLLPCAVFMTVSIYSTYIYWLIMFFVRLKKDLMSSNPNQDLTDSQDSFNDGVTVDKIQQWYQRKNPIVLNYCTFYSVVTWLLLLRLLVMTTNMTVTFCLRDHLFIWSVICPKFLYEFVLTALNIIFLVLISVIFTHDNCFFLHL